MALLIWVFFILSSCSSIPPLETPPSQPNPVQTTPSQTLFPEAPQPVEEAPEDDPEDEDFFVYGELPADIDAMAVRPFNEIWGYMVAGKEQALKANYPLSDVVYFGAEIDVYGRLTDVPNRKSAGSFPGRLHLAVACNSRSLTHFILEPGSAVRRQLVADLLAAAKPYDGLQIDFELIPNRDGAAFLAFLKELREGLGDRMFTAALPARRKTLADDVYDYGMIKPLVDRIFVMAYDEHWSTSEPGPIASMGWCQAVAEYALKTIGPEKLIMGLPFYGRTWGSVNTFRAFFHSGIERIKSENGMPQVRREAGIPTFTYETPVKVTVYYEDAYSLALRLSLYRNMGVSAVGFWSLGQEDTTIWNFLKAAQTKELP